MENSRRRGEEGGGEERRKGKGRERKDQGRSWKETMNGLGEDFSEAEKVQLVYLLMGRK